MESNTTSDVMHPRSNHSRGRSRSRSRQRQQVITAKDREDELKPVFCSSIGVNPAMEKARLQHNLLKQGKSLVRGRHPKSLLRKRSQIFQKSMDSELRVKSLRGNVPLNAAIAVPDDIDKYMLDTGKASRRPRRELDPTAVVTAAAHKAVNVHRMSTRKRALPDILTRKLDKMTLPQVSKRGHHQAKSVHASLQGKDPVLTMRFKPSDFNCFPGAKIFYGSMVAFQNSVSGLWLSVDHRNGALCTVSEAAPWAQRVFRLMKISQPQDNSPVHFGDDVWICISSGTPEMRWSNGRVMATHTRTAHNMITGDTSAGSSKGEFPSVVRGSTTASPCYC